MKVKTCDFIDTETKRKITKRMYDIIYAMGI
ncbi:hypothetical protein Si129_00805 [Streptococcus infantarius subsp. infantarius]|nr:hypothetical protein [Streptococcus infantarius subsp. infantarius]